MNPASNSDDAWTPAPCHGVSSELYVQGFYKIDAERCFISIQFGFEMFSATFSDDAQRVLRITQHVMIRAVRGGMVQKSVLLQCLFEIKWWCALLQCTVSPSRCAREY